MRERKRKFVIKIFETTFIPLLQEDYFYKDMFKDMIEKIS